MAHSPISWGKARVHARPQDHDELKWLLAAFTLHSVMRASHARSQKPLACAVRFGSFSEVRSRDRDVRCSLRSRHRHGRTECLKSAMNLLRASLFDHLIGGLT